MKVKMISIPELEYLQLQQTIAEDFTAPLQDFQDYM
jgi:hypothetical protein